MGQYDGWKYDWWKYDGWKYDEWKYDRWKYDWWKYDWWKYDGWESTQFCSENSKKWIRREDQKKKVNGNEKRKEKM